MAETRTIDKKDELKIEDTPKKVRTQSRKAKNDKDINELRSEVQRLVVDIKAGKEPNTSLLGKARREVARALTKLNSNKQN